MKQTTVQQKNSFTNILGSKVILTCESQGKWKLSKPISASSFGQDKSVFKESFLKLQLFYSE